MKFALFTPNFPPERGACARRVAQLAESLHDAGHEVIVFTPFIEGSTSNYNFSVHQLSVSYFKTPSLWKRLWSATRISFGFLQLGKEIEAFKPNFIWVQAPPWPLPVVGWWLSKKYQAKFILNLSDLHPSALLDLGKLKDNWFYRFLQRIERYFYRRADIIFGQSEEILTYVRDHTAEKSLVKTPTTATAHPFPGSPTTGRDFYLNNSFLYRNGIRPTHFSKKSTPSKHFRWVYIGSLGEAQDIRTFLEKIDFKELQQEFHLFGTGQQEKSIRVIANQSDWVTLHPPIPPEEVAETLVQFDAALIVQKQHIFGTVPSKIYEAMNAGLPILLLGAGESAKIIQESESGDSVTPQNWAAIRQTMQEFPKRKDLEQLGKNGQQFAHKYFSHEVQFQRFLQAVLAQQNEEKREDEKERQDIEKTK
ncbi:MAG: glycosyltransferase family 4 protein [Bacteroidota bacterium]